MKDSEEPEEGWMKNTVLLDVFHLLLQLVCLQLIKATDALRRFDAEYVL